MRYLGVLLAWLATVALSAPTLWYWFQALSSLSSRVLSLDLVRLAITALAIAFTALFVVLCVAAEHWYSTAPDPVGRFVRTSAAQLVLLALGYGAASLLGPGLV